jgi:DNA-binding Xre family transcriptional regulator
MASLLFCAQFVVYWGYPNGPTLTSSPFGRSNRTRVQLSLNRVTELFMHKSSVIMSRNVESPFMQLLISKKKTPADVAAALDVNERSVMYWLAGSRKPRLTIAQVQDLCRLLDCSVFDLPVDFSRHA